MISNRSGQNRFLPANIATALTLGRVRHRRRRWSRPARSLLAGAVPILAVRRSPRRVLCTDRHSALADSLAAALRRVGFDARGCDDGGVALVEVTEFRPQACVLDLEMPGIGGYELAQWVRSELGGAALLVGLTDHSGEDIDRLAEDAGFDLVLTRPADETLIIGLLAGP